MKIIPRIFHPTTDSVKYRKRLFTVTQASYNSIILLLFTHTFILRPKSVKYQEKILPSLHVANTSKISIIFHYSAHVFHSTRQKCKIPEKILSPVTYTSKSSISITLFFPNFPQYFNRYFHQQRKKKKVKINIVSTISIIFPPSIYDIFNKLSTTLSNKGARPRYVAYIVPFFKTELFQHLR